MFDKNISGQRLRDLRLSKKLSLKDVADAIGTSKSTLGNIEREVKPASLDMTIKLADFLDCSVDYLVGRSNDPVRH